ncbi:MAG: hypothetical protein ABIA59_07470 [Candidatus Latescibacterota bacterium]
MFDFLYKCNRNKAGLTNRIHIHLLAAILIGAAGAVVLSTASCYTILKHPRVTEAGYESPSEYSCLSCHTSYELDMIFHPPVRPPSRQPWWIDHDWGNETETLPIREGIRPSPGKIDDPPLKIKPISGPSGKIKTGDPVVEEKSDDSKEKKESDDRSVRPKKPKKKKKDAG